MRNGVLLSGHTGVEYECPRNTFISFFEAVLQGYDWVELDLGVTKDNLIVCLHDKTINKTARNSDGSEIAEPILLEDLTYVEALSYDFGIMRGEQFKGVKVPLFADVLRLCYEYGVTIKIDNKIWGMSELARNTAFSLMKEAKTKVCISCFDLENVREVLSILPNAEVSLDGEQDEAVLRELSSLLPRERVSVWVAIDYEMASWAPKSFFATYENVETIRKYAKVAIWAIKDVASFDKAVKMYHPELAETIGNIKPEQGRILFGKKKPNENLTIRHTEEKDLSAVLDIYAHAKMLMRCDRNDCQWIIYPKKEVLLKDMENGNSYVICDNEKVVGTFALIYGIDKTYLQIDGAWKNDLPYGTIHRIASSGEYANILEVAIKFAMEKTDNVRIDTHKDNKIMQKALAKNGFDYCGMIHIIDDFSDHSERLAFQKVK